MKRVKLEVGLLRYALGVFKNTTGIEYDIDETGKHAPGQVPDALIRLKKDGVEYPYAIEVKARLTNPILGAVIDRVRRFPQKGMIITDYVNPNIADKLREMDIAFIDAVGNAFLNELGLYIFVKGNKPGEIERIKNAVVLELDQNVYPKGIESTTQVGTPTLTTEKKKRGLREKYFTETLAFTPAALAPTIKPGNQAFQPAGLKVVFAFLCDREIINAPYREIAKATDVALGTVGWVIRNLKEQGILIERKKGKRRRLVDRKKLLEKWVEAYNEKLRPKLIAGRYTTPQDNWWQGADLRNYGALWGGEVAAARLTGYLKPAVATIYVKEMPVQLLRELRMRHDPKGNVEIMRQFWDDNFNPDNLNMNNKHIGIAPLIIVYADLLVTGDARNLETARILYDKEIAGFIGEN